MTANLPENWASASLEDICHIVQGQSPPGESYNSEGLGIPFFQGKAEFGDLHPTVCKWTTSPAKFAEAGDVLLSVRAPVGPTNVASLDCAIGRGLAALKPLGGTEARFVLYLLRWLERGWVTKGTTFAAITSDGLRGREIVVPPLKEQARIIAELDLQLSRLDSAVAVLKQAQAKLKRYRQSVLKAAVRGKLVPTEAELARGEGRDYEPASVLLERILNARRARMGKKYKEPAAPDVSILPALPEGWCWATFGSVAVIQSNLVQTKEFQEWPHIAPNHIESGTGKLLSFQTIEADGVFSPKHLFHKGQILYSKIRPYLCKAIIADFDGLCSADMYPIRGEAVTNEYLLLWLLSSDFTQLASHQQGRTVLPKINQDALNLLPVPIAPVDEQKRISAQCQHLFTTLEDLSAEVFAAQSRAGAFRFAVLKWAFSGNLVPQDPNDEPASELLARIRAERVANTKPEKKSRRRKPDMTTIGVQA